MPNCTHCGAQYLEGATRCNKCGVTIGHQVRAQKDAVRSRNGQIVRAIGWVVALVVLALVAPPAYRAAGAGYYEFRLNTAKRHANGACDGPVTDTMTQAQKDPINKCLSENADLQQAQADYSNFTGTRSH